MEQINLVETLARALGASPLARQIAAGNAVLVQDPGSTLAAQVRAMDVRVAGAFFPSGASYRARLLASASRPTLEAAR